MPKKKPITKIGNIWHGAFDKRQSEVATDVAPPPHLDNSIDQKENTNFEQAKEITQMPTQYLDGSFTYNVRKTGLMRYQFMFAGRREAVYGYTKQECYNQRTGMIAGTIRKIKGETNSKNKTAYALGDWCKHYYDTFRRRKGNKQTQDENDRYIKEITKYFGQATIQRIKVDELQAFINTYGAVPGKRKRLAQFLKSALQKAADLQYIKYNPFVAVEVERYKGDSHPVISIADQRKLCEALASVPVYSTLFMFLCCTGLRISEAIHTIPHLDFDNHTINITDKDTATKKHKRQIPFLPELIDEDKQNLLSGVTSRYVVGKYFEKLFKQLDINATLHSFRVTFISCCNHVGINPKQIQEWAGHSSIQMTMDTYAKLLKRDGTSPILDYLRHLKQDLDL